MVNDISRPNPFLKIPVDVRFKLKLLDIALGYSYNPPQFVLMWGPKAALVWRLDDIYDRDWEEVATIVADTIKKRTEADAPLSRY